MSVEHTLLAMLSFWPSTGYTIKSEFEHKAAGLYWGMSYGSIYPKLKKLEEEGYIFMVEQEEEGRKKKMYELSPKGWLEFESWLNAPSVYPIMKDELLMKMSTWHEDMDIAILINHLLKRKEETEDMLHFVQEWNSNGYSYISKVGALAIRHGELRLESELKWIEESIEALKTDNLPKGQNINGNTEKILERRRKAMGEKREE